jgi:hypothetical protein
MFKRKIRLSFTLRSQAAQLNSLSRSDQLAFPEPLPGAALAGRALDLARFIAGLAPVL